MKKRVLVIILRVLSYVLVAAIASGLTMAFGQNKITQVENLIKLFYVDEEGLDYNALEDEAAAALVAALPDGWSYYVSAEEYADFANSRANTFVGVGITIQVREDATGFDIVKVEPGSGAESAGILPGDVLVKAAGHDLAGLSSGEVSTYVRGEEGTSVELELLREGNAYTVTVERTKIQVQVVTYAKLEAGVGYIRIENFNERSADDAIAAVKDLQSQQVSGLIFDVRGNPGGFKEELVQLLDYLLPEGTLFQSLSYDGSKETDKSDADCVKMPMAVLMDGESYSAAEFFAAALEEYDWAVTVGEPTVGKGHYQITYQLADGSAVALSSGRYYTPKGVSLSDVGGLKPNVAVEIDDETAAKLYSGILPYEEDAQLQAAIEALNN